MDPERQKFDLKVKWERTMRDQRNQLLFNFLILFEGKYTFALTLNSEPPEFPSLTEK